MILKPRLFRKPNLSHPLSGGLVGLWLMNADSGNTVQDLSGNGHTGLLSGGASWTTGKYGSAINFSSGDEVIFGSVTEVPKLVVDHITVVTWIYLNANLTQWTPVYSNGSYNTSGIWFALSSAESLCAYHTSDPGGYDAFVSTGAAVPINEWCQIAVTWDGTTKTVYLNGAYNGSESIAAGNLDWSGGTDFVWGAGDYGTPNYKLDHGYVYNRALSASEIQQLYREPFCMMYDPYQLDLYSGYVPPVVSGNAGIMTCNTGFWGATY